MANYNNPTASSRAVPRRYLVLAWLCAAAAIAYLQRSCVGAAEVAIRNEFQLERQESGLVLSAFFMTYAVFQIPSSWVGASQGTRRALSWFTVLFSLANAATAAPWGRFGLIVSRLGMGAAQAGIFPCTTQTTGAWFPSTQRGIASAALASFMSIGAAVGSHWAGHLMGWVGWRMMFLIFSLPGIVWAAVFWWWFRDLPEDDPRVSPEELELIRQPDVSLEAQPDPEPLAHRADDGSQLLRQQPPVPVWLELLGSRSMWCVCAQQFFRAAGYVFFLSWFATYLKETAQLDDAKAGFLNSLPLWAVVPGSLLGGIVSDRLLAWTGSRRVARQFLAAGSMTACAIAILAAFAVQSVQAGVLIISLGSFFAAMGGPAGYAITIDMGGRHLPTVFACMNMAGNLGAWFFPVLVPILLKYGGWDLVLFLFADLYLAAAVCWLLFDSRGTMARSSDLG